MSARRAASDRLRFLALIALTCVFLPGCETGPNRTMELPPDSLQLRQLQTRRIEGIDEPALLAASVGVLQDLGFNIDESEMRLGVIVASKDRSAVDVGEAVGSLIADALFEAAMGALLSELFGGNFDDEEEDDDEIVYDVTQKIRVSIVTRPALDSSGLPRRDAQILRVTMQRLVLDSESQISHAESIEDPKLYQTFFDLLSKSIFLELQVN